MMTVLHVPFFCIFVLEGYNRKVVLGKLGMGSEDGSSGCANYL